MWAGPAQIAGLSTDPENGGPISTQNDWANLGPTYFFFLFFGVGPDPGQIFRLGQNWSGLRWEVNYFYRCMQNEFYMQRPKQVA
jgi:hypothetical protein